jgi:hypothetical protein
MAIQFPFEIEWTRDTNPELFVDVVVQSLRPQTLVLPKGESFLSYERFQDAYEVLKRHSHGFRILGGDQCWAAVEEDGLAYVVLREAHETGLLAAGFSARRGSPDRERLTLFDVEGIGPAAGMASSASDLAKFARWQLRLRADGGERVLRYP